MTKREDIRDIRCNGQTLKPAKFETKNASRRIRAPVRARARDSGDVVLSPCCSVGFLGDLKQTI